MIWIRERVVYNMTKEIKEQMINNIIRRFGFEDKRTILFCTMIEQLKDTKATTKKINRRYNRLMRT